MNKSKWTLYLYLSLSLKDLDDNPPQMWITGDVILEISVMTPIYK